MAVGSFVIAVCQLLRLLLTMVDKATQEQQQGNLLVKLAMKCAPCALWCLQKTVEFVSYWGYVFVAVRRLPRCPTPPLKSQQALRARPRPSTPHPAPTHLQHANTPCPARVSARMSARVHGHAYCILSPPDCKNTM